ncbi:hypothetical protein JOC49_001805 [Fusibacter tunisiensis]|uniref:Uncharacterized protein n=1 Tax=Fusibacter tunisiensis TaxID=1008308 RepID=A0ABS2MSK0_9FIRM|nr:hypothetical protein [Fusibacter tunisiensis]
MKSLKIKPKKTHWIHMAIPTFYPNLMDFNFFRK